MHLLNRARTAFQEEHKAKKTYRQFYRQSAFPAMTFSNLTAPGGTSKYLQSLLISEKAGVGGSTPSLATTF